MKYRFKVSCFWGGRFLPVFLLGQCYGAAYAAEETAQGNDSLWVKKSYYKDAGELVTQQERFFDENGNILKESVHSALGVPKRKNSKSIIV